MPANESEFEQLVDAYDAARRSFDKAIEIGQAPVYETPNGVITLDSVEHYKRLLAAFEEKKAAKEEAKQGLIAAKQNLEAWFPPSVATALNRGVAMFAPSIKGVIGLLKRGDAYLVERGHSDADVRRKMGF